MVSAQPTARHRLGTVVAWLGVIGLVLGLLAPGAAAQEAEPEPQPVLDVTHLAGDGIDAGAIDSADETVDAPGIATFTIVVTNTGDGVAEDVSIHDVLPPGSWDIEPPAGGAACTSSIQVTPGSGSAQHASCTFDALAPGASGTMTVSRPLDPVEDCGAVLVNAVSVTSGASSGEPGPVSSEATIRARCTPAIELDVAGPELAHFGERVTYDFTVINPVGVDLSGVALDAPQCDPNTLAVVGAGDGDEVLAVGESWSYTCGRLIAHDDVSLAISSLCCASPDGSLPTSITGSTLIDLPATVTARDNAGRPASDADFHRLEVISPAIELDTTVDNDVPAAGDTLTYSFAVTNTGDTTLFDVVVVDDVLGEVGTVAELAVGQTVELTVTAVASADMPRRNTATASGTDVLGLEVSDTDDATIGAIVEGVAITAARTLPATGDGTDALLVIAGVLLMLGGAAVLLSTSERLVAAGERW